MTQASKTQGRSAITRDAGRKAPRRRMVRRWRPVSRAIARIDDALAEKLGRILLRTIHSELGNSDFFTREDLLHLSAFQHIATISRYHLVCAGVRQLLDSGQLVRRSRTDLCLPEHAEQADRAGPLHQQYASIIQRVLLQFRPGTLIGVMDIVSRWQTDRHLTENTKRMLVRRSMRRLEHDGLIEGLADFRYQVTVPHQEEHAA